MGARVSSSLQPPWLAPEATREQLLRVHEAGYVDSIASSSPQQGIVQLDPDTAMNPYSYPAALRAAGAAVLATDKVANGEMENAFCAVRPPGHHAERARAMGADHCINYKSTPNWDEKVLELTDGQGADHVIDTGGVGTLPKSYLAVGPGGTVSVIGVMTRPEGDLSPYPLMTKFAMVRGVFAGTTSPCQLLAS